MSRRGLPKKSPRRIQRKADKPVLQEVSMEVAGELTPQLPQTHRNSKIEQMVTKPQEIHELPWGYGDTGIVALPRDPYWVFAYWEISETRKEEIRRRFGNNAWESSQPILRVYDTTNLYFFDSRKTQEIMINDYANNWYIRTGQPDRTYYVELGRLLPDGTYIFIVRSNFVTMPRDRVSDVVDVEWLLPATAEKRLYSRIGGGPSSPEFIKEFAEKISAEVYISSPMNW